MGHEAAFAVIAALMASQRSDSRESFQGTHPSTASTRVDRPKVTVLNFAVGPDLDSTAAYQLWWRVLKQLCRKFLLAR